MKVTVIADPVIPVPPLNYGGAERVVASLCDGLASRGHSVVLVAGRGSRNYGTLFRHAAPDKASLFSRARRKLLFQPLSLAASWRADVVHNFGRIDYLWSLQRTSLPLLHTFENPIADGEVDALQRGRRGRLMLVSVSDHQRKKFEHRGSWRTVYNAVDVRAFPFCTKPADPPYLAFLGRLTANKGVHVAIDVARKAGMKLKLAGNVSNEHGGAAYFEQRVRPALGPDVEWVGEVNDAQKTSFLGGATALLFPIQWDEPFGIVLAEALACGTPVIALRRASTPEIVRDGETGFLCDSIDEMAGAVHRVSALRRADCRAFAESTFSAEVMVERYLELYRELLAGGQRSDGSRGRHR
jgi:glycosyltransferase involved in cell wall biosynthesis